MYAIIDSLIRKLRSFTLRLAQGWHIELRTNSIRLITNRSQSTKKRRRKWEKGRETVRERERERGGKNTSATAVRGGTRVASAERCVRYLRGSQPAGIVIVWKYVYTRGLKYTVGIRPNDDRSPSFFHLLSPRERHTVLWNRKRKRKRDR